MNRDTIKQLIETLKSSAAQELSVRDGERLIRIRRRMGPVTITQAQPSASEPISAGPEETVAGTVPVRASLVGLFYRGRGAETEPLVKLGDHVDEGQVVGTIDALRRLTDVVSPTAGKVVQIPAEDGHPVQYGQVLMPLTPSEGGEL